MTYWFHTLAFYLVTLVAILSFTLVRYINRKLSHWKTNNIPQVDPKFPFGNITPFALGKKNLGDVVKHIYLEIKKTGSKYGGLYFFLEAHLLPIDLDFIKTILIKDFEHFTDHGAYNNEEKDPLTGNLFSLDGHRWKNLRAKLSPTFTSGKLKMMFPTLISSNQQLKDVIDDFIQNGKPMDVKDILARCATDNIMSCAFGVECNSLDDPENEFRKWGKRVFEIKTLRDSIAQILGFTTPGILNFLNIKYVDEQVSNFYMDVVKDIVHYRETNHVERKDFMHLLLQLKNDGKLQDEDRPYQNSDIRTKLTLNEIAAQCFIFFLGGFETSSTTTTFILYELCRHQDIQDKVREEIIQILKAHNEITYDAILEMTYMDQVIDETLRKYPPVSFLNRICTQDYKLSDGNYIVKKGDRVLISVLGIHTDPEYYPEPDKFDPERFNEENKSKRHAFAHIPFGEGPRICIGMRFGIMQIKVALTLIIGNYKLRLNPKTPFPLLISAKSNITTPADTIWLDVEKLV